MLPDCALIAQCDDGEFTFSISDGFIVEMLKMHLASKTFYKPKNSLNSKWMVKRMIRDGMRKKLFRKDFPTELAASAASNFVFYWMTAVSFARNYRTSKFTGEIALNPILSHHCA